MLPGIKSTAARRPTTRPYCLSAVLLLGLTVLLTVPTLPAQTTPPEKTTPAPPKTISYRQWLAPLEHIDDWPYGQGKYIQFNRQQFEQWVAQLAPHHPAQSNPAESPFTNIALNADWEDGQLVRGTGIISLPQTQSAALNAYPTAALNAATLNAPTSVDLPPPGFWMDAAELENGTPVPLVAAADGKLKFLIPPIQPLTQSAALDAAALVQQPTALVPSHQIRFRWSMRSRSNVPSGTVFDFAFPPCPAAELQLTLPNTLVPSLSGGIVQEVPEHTPLQTTKHWRILFGRQALHSLTITPQKKTAANPHRTAVRQTLVYNIAPQGTDVRSAFVFDKNDARISELALDLDPSLRLVEIRYGEQKMPWTTYSSDDLPSGTGIIVDLSNVPKSDPQELTLWAIAANNESAVRPLPRIRIVSDNVFWQETRCHIVVQSPYKVQAVDAPNALRIASASSAERTDSEVLTFQFFDADAAVSVHLADSQPKITFNSAAQVLAGNVDVQGTVIVDASAADGSTYVLTLPLAPGWTADSVKSVYRLTDSVKTSDANEIAFWDIAELPSADSAPQDDNSVKNNVLTLQLKQPLMPKQVLRFRLTGRCPMTAEEEHRLGEIAPLAASVLKKGTHLLAVQASAPFQLQYRSPLPALPGVAGSLARLYQNFDEMPLGTLIQLDAQTRDIPFEVTRLNPNYTAEITQDVNIQEKEILLTCSIQCRTQDSAAERVYVHFSGGPKNAPPLSWQWSCPTDSIQARRLTEEDLGEVPALPGAEDGELWEIRFASPQSAPFEIKGVASALLSETFPVPLAAVPAASSQKGTVLVESLHPGNYRIINTHLRAFPVAVPPSSRYQTLCGAFRYDPTERFPSALTVQRFRPDTLPPAAWVWALRLHSQYEPEGLVKNRAVFFLENQGKKNLQIQLPEGVAAADVRTVLQNGQRLASRSAPTGAEHETLLLTLPEGERFITLSLEYVYQNSPLNQHRPLKPKYPSVDVPVLAQDWVIWYPPDFEAVQRFQPVALRPNRHKSWGTRPRLDALLPESWRRTLYGAKQRTEADNAAAVFFGLLDERIGDTEKAVSKTLNWSDLFGKEKELSNALNELQKEGEKTAAKVYVDKHALSMLGVQPDTPVSLDGIKRSTELFRHSGLTVLIAAPAEGGNREYSFYITSVLRCAMQEHYHSLPLSSAARYFPDAADKDAKGKRPALKPEFGQSPDWVSAADWNRRNDADAPQWTLAPSMLPAVRAVPDWNVFEVPPDTEHSVHLIYRPAYTAYHFLAFLAAAVLTSGKRFAHPVRLLCLMLLFGVITMCIPVCYAGIPYGAFLGTTVSLGFALVHSRHLSVSPFKPYHRIQADAPAYGVVSDSTSHGKINVGDNTVVNYPVPVLPLFLLALLSSLSFVSSAAGQETGNKQVPAEPAAAVEPEPYRVFFPIDEQRRIVGNTVWAPMDFLQFLSRNVKNSGANTPLDWSIERAEYQGTLAYRSQTQQLELSDDFKVSYEVLLNTGSTVITLPPLPLRQEHILWDARPVPITQRTNKDGKYDALLIPIESETAGKHQLVLSLVPKQELSNDVCRIALDIPKVPNAVLRLKTPQDAPPVRVAHSLGAVAPNTLEGTTLTAQIGPTDKLAFSWNTEVVGTDALLIEADQYFRLSPRTTQVEMRAVFRLRIDNGKIRQLQLQTDPRWHRSGQFLCEDAVIDSVETTPNADNSIGEEQTEITRIVFQKPVSGTITLEAGFVLPNFNGIGKIQLPQFKTLNARINRSMLGVFPDPLLQLEYPKTGLSASWQPSDSKPPTTASGETPAAEYDLTKTDSSWVLSIRAKKIVPVLTQHQSVLFGDGSAAALWRNEFQTVGDVFQQRFTVPSDVEIETVESLNSENVPVEVRWGKTGGAVNNAVNGATQYTLFFSRPVSGKFSVNVRGRFPAPVGKSVAVAPLTFGEVQVKELLLTLFRTPAVIASLTANETAWSSSATVPASAAPEYALSRNIPLRSYQWTAPAAETAALAAAPPLNLTVQLSPNRPDIFGDQVITLRRSNRDLWEVAFDTVWEIRNGECAALPLLWDARCTSITAIDPPMSHRIQQEEGQTVLTLLPSVPFTGRQRITIKAALDTPGSTLSVPRFAVLPDAAIQADIRCFVVLPKYGSEELPIPWNYTLLDKADAETLEYLKNTTDTSEAGFLFLHALGSNYSAVIAREKNRLVSNFFDIAFFVQQNGTLYGTADIDLKNRGQDSCTLYLPDDYELIHFSSGSLAKGMKVSPNRWRFDLWNSDFPHRIRIIFRGAVPKAVHSNGVQPTALKFPVLEGVSVMQTVWTVSFAPTGQDAVPLSVAAVHENLFGFPSVASSTELAGETVAQLGRYVPTADVSAAQQKLNIIRLDNLIKVLDAVSTSSAAFTTEDGRRWLSRWAAQWNQLEQQIDEQSLGLVGAQAVPILRDFGAKDAAKGTADYIAMILDSNNLPPLFQALKQNYQSKTGGILLEEGQRAGEGVKRPLSGGGGSVCVFGVSAGGVRELRFESLPGSAWGLSGASGLVLGFMALLPLLLFVRKSLLGDLFLQFPYFWGSVIGLLCWGYCPSNGIGLAILFFLGLSLLIPVWKRHRRIGY